MDKKQLYLNPDEAKFLSMAVLRTIETLNDTSKNERINWNPEARKYFKEMLTAANGLKVKMQKLGFDMRDLPPFEDGDEEEFLTKQS